ncbi:UNVERIFIED_CONTAM: hypothetical protein Sangu_0617600 [Sesamum angustifolium]|uniref:Uncharacterized protein n=1 Tax=Sesamum angustifolium TaxID=2727405 RepID=A0AAW2QC74_9LAMI
MSSSRLFISFILIISLSIQGLDEASAASGNRRLLNFPGIPTLPTPSFFPPLLPTPSYPNPDTPALPQFPPITFPGNPSSNPVVPYFPFFYVPPPSITSP